MTTNPTPSCGNTASFCLRDPCCRKTPTPSLTATTSIANYWLQRCDDLGDAEFVKIPVDNLRVLCEVARLQAEAKAPPNTTPAVQAELNKLYTPQELLRFCDVLEQDKWAVSIIVAREFRKRLLNIEPSIGERLDEAEREQARIDNAKVKAKAEPAAGMPTRERIARAIYESDVIALRSIAKFPNDVTGDDYKTWEQQYLRRADAIMSLLQGASVPAPKVTAEIEKDEYGPISANKPHLGRIDEWWKYPCDSGLGYLIRGRFLDHPQFAGETGHTSYIVKHDEATGEVETRNSKYTLIGAAITGKPSP